MLDPLVHLTVIRPYPPPAVVMTWDLDPQMTSCRKTTTLPGGFNGLSVGLATAAMPNLGFLAGNYDVREFDQIELRQGDTLHYRGRVDRPVSTDGRLTGFTAVGAGQWGMVDDWYEAPDSPPASTAGAVLRTILGAAAPHIPLGAPFGDSLLPHTLRDFDHMYPADVVTALGKEGGAGSLSVPWDFAVYEDATWQPRTPPAQYPGATQNGARYWIGAAGTIWTHDARDCCSDLAIDYTSLDTGPGTKLTARAGPDLTFVATYGFRRRVLLSAPSSLHDATAAQLAKTYLALRSKPQISATVTRTGGCGLELPGGSEADPALTRAGEWVQIGDREPVVIIGTDYDYCTRALSCTCETYPRGYYADLSRVMQFARYYELGLSPTSVTAAFAA